MINGDGALFRYCLSVYRLHSYWMLSGDFDKNDGMYNARRKDNEIYNQLDMANTSVFQINITYLHPFKKKKKVILI